MRSAQKPEIMSPAGHWPQLRAAIEAGADSVYFGLHHFTARAKVGFSLTELPEVMRTLHRRGVKGFVTFNTLVFEHELGAAERTLESYPHLPAVRGDLLAKLGRTDEARREFERAATLTRNERERALFLHRAAACEP